MTHHDASWSSDFSAKPFLSILNLTRGSSLRSFVFCSQFFVEPNADATISYYFTIYGLKHIICNSTISLCFFEPQKKYHIKIPGGNAVNIFDLHHIGVFLLWTNMIRNTKHNVQQHDTPCPIASGGKLPHPFLTEHTFTWKWETKERQKWSTSWCCSSGVIIYPIYWGSFLDPSSFGKFPTSI